MLAPPSMLQRSKELLVGRDLVRLARSAPALRHLPRGDGAPVVLIPGFATTDASLVLLRRLLTRLGHDVRSPGLGRVGDDVEVLAAVLASRVAEIAEETGRRVALVGWSIGGVLAREAARERPDVVRQVVTFGSPVVGGPSYTALAWRYSTGELATIRAGIEERNRQPITVPVTAIWSPNDGIVTPAACIDDRSPRVEHVEVASTHVGMGLDPDVWAVVAHRLADADADADESERSG